MSIDSAFLGEVSRQLNKRYYHKEIINLMYYVYMQNYSGTECIAKTEDFETAKSIKEKGEKEHKTYYYWVEKVTTEKDEEGLLTTTIQYYE